MEETRCPCCRQILPTQPDLLFDPESRVVIRQGRFAALTPQEASLFQSLHSASPRLRTKHQLLDDLYWQEAEEPSIKIIDVYICKIRKKLTPLAVDIATDWGRGYRLVPVLGEIS